MSRFTWFLQVQPSATPTYHPVLLMVVAEDRETTAIAKQCDLPERFVIDAFGDDNNGRVGGTDREILVGTAQTPFICLKGKKLQGLGQKTEYYRLSEM